MNESYMLDFSLQDILEEAYYCQASRIHINNLHQGDFYAIGFSNYFYRPVKTNIKSSNKFIKELDDFLYIHQVSLLKNDKQEGHGVVNLRYGKCIFFFQKEFGISNSVYYEIDVSFYRDSDSFRGFFSNEIITCPHCGIEFKRR